MSWCRNILIVCVVFISGCFTPGKGEYVVESYPQSLSHQCREGNAKIYDECGSQTEIMKAALISANESGKTLLMVYGAEWCIWCHVFDKYVKGGYRAFEYEWEYHDGDLLSWNMLEWVSDDTERQARKLNKYVSENFVVVHIEGHFSEDGLDVIDAIGFDRNEMSFYPFIFSVTADGKYAAHMLAYDAIPGLEIRQSAGLSYRGFDREILLRELVRLKQAAEKG